MRIIVAGSKPWSHVGFEDFRDSLENGHCSFVKNPSELKAVISSLGGLPTTVFVLHWSWIIPKVLLDQAIFVCFHMTDLPFGRGGSPLQNLISVGISKTKLTAFVMDEGIDTGPILMKKELSLHGSASEIFLRQTLLSYAMANQIATSEIVPIDQSGEVVEFRRRSPDMSDTFDAATPHELYDSIRMVDADTYPRAYLQAERFRAEFRDVKFHEGKITCTTTFVFAENKGDSN
jgi:methionyl-tRNA formyltransferase